MAFNHLLRLAAACAIPLSLAACGGSSSDGDDPPPMPEGDHHGYVVSEVSVPSTQDESDEFALDVGSATSTKLDGKVDNALGALFVGIHDFVQIQPSITNSINRGTINLLLDLQTTDFTSASASGLSVKLGTMPTPPACADTADTACRHHLDGTASFQIAPDSPTDSLVAGKIVGGTFNGGPGNLTLALTFGGTTPSTLHLLHARARASGITEAGISKVIIGGVVTETELKTQIGPVVRGQIVAYLTGQCTGEVTPPSCGCAGTPGTVMMTLDVNHDCAITVDEVFNNFLVASVLKLDSCSTDSCAAPDGYSIGLAAKAVKATFPM